MDRLAVLKLLGLLAEPLSQALVLSLIGFFLYWRGRPRASLACFSVAIFWLWLASSAFFADFLLQKLERDYPPVAAENLPHADAIVLLGGAVRGEVSTETLADLSAVGDRLLYATAAYKAGKAPVVVVTGGAADGLVPEATLIRDILLTMGVPASAIVTEARNRVTADNGRYTRETLSIMGVESVLLVTSAFHMRRALLVFEPLDVRVFPAATDYQVLPGTISVWHYIPNVKALQRTTWALHEMAGYLYYLTLESPTD